MELRHSKRDYKEISFLTKQQATKKLKTEPKIEEEENIEENDIELPNLSKTFLKKL